MSKKGEYNIPIYHSKYAYTTINLSLKLSLIIWLNLSNVSPIMSIAGDDRAIILSLKKSVIISDPTKEYGDDEYVIAICSNYIILNND